MEYQDSNSERRNLVTISMAFIIYAVAGGQITGDGHLTIQPINITFHNTEYLTYITWTIFVWFLIRYWQTHRDAIREAFAKDMQVMNVGWLLNFLICEKIKAKFILMNQDNGMLFKQVQQLFVSGKTVNANIVFINTNSRPNIEHSQQLGFDQQDSGYVIKVAKIYVALTRAAFTNTVMPYILAGIAFVLNFPWANSLVHLKKLFM